MKRKKKLLRKTVVTPKLEVVFTHLKEAEDFKNMEWGANKDPEFNVTLKLDPVQHKEFITYIDNMRKEVFEQVTEGVGQREKKNYVSLDSLKSEYKKDEQGNKIETGMLLLKASRLEKLGRPQFLDAKRNLIEQPDLWGGSVVKVIITFAGWNVGKQCGVKAYLDAIQVIELKDSGSEINPLDFFKEEEGYVDNQEFSTIKEALDYNIEDDINDDNNDDVVNFGRDF